MTQPADYLVKLTTGLATRMWCDTCQTNDRFSVDVFTHHAGEPRPLTTMERCLTCEPGLIPSKG